MVERVESHSYAPIDIWTEWVKPPGLDAISITRTLMAPMTAQTQVGDWMNVQLESLVKRRAHSVGQLWQYDAR
jgi:hypothetical protein